MFSSLENATARSRSFSMSVVVHAVVLTVLLALPLLFPDSLPMRYNVTTLMLHLPAEPPKVVRIQKPLPAPPRVAPVRHQPILRKDLVASAPEVKPPDKAPLPKINASFPEPKLEKPSLTPAPAPAPQPPSPPKVANTGVLPTGETAKPTLNKPAREVQTGGFGDPNGVRGEGRPDRPAMIASLGSFDLPKGPGTGNGTGGTRGSAGVVAATGFGTGIAGSGDSGSRRGGSGGGGGSGQSGGGIQQGGFGDARPDQSSAPRTVRNTAPSQTPAEILFKPRPDYTETARQARVEGEVLLRVMFSADGDIRVLDVVKGMPHGLNESALRAAEKIRFKPATKDGRPVDSVAVVHIIFQMAY